MIVATSRTDHSGHSGRPNRLLQKEQLPAETAQAIVPLSSSPTTVFSLKLKEKTILAENIVPRKKAQSEWITFAK